MLSTKKTRKVIKENNDHPRKKVRLNLVFLVVQPLKVEKIATFQKTIDFQNFPATIGFGLLKNHLR